MTQKKKSIKTKIEGKTLHSLNPKHNKSKPESPLSRSRTRLHFFWRHRMQHDLVRQLLCIGRVALAPVVADGVCENVPCAVEGSAGDGAPDGRIALETVLRVLIPEVEGAVTASGAEGTVDGVEGDIV